MGLSYSETFWYDGDEVQVSVSGNYEADVKFRYLCTSFHLPIECVIAIGKAAQMVEEANQND